MATVLGCLLVCEARGLKVTPHQSCQSVSGEILARVQSEEGCGRGVSCHPEEGLHGSDGTCGCVGGCHGQSRGDPEWVSPGCLNHNSEVARLHGYVSKEHIVRSAERAGCGGSELTPPQETMETQGESCPGGQPVQGVKGLVSENLWPQRCQQG